MNQRSITAIADYLAQRPIGRIISVLPLTHDDYVVSIEDRRDGREHVLTNYSDLETWLESFKAGECLKPSKGFCDCCCNPHFDHDTDGELFDLCIRCQTELTALALESEC